MPQPCAIASMLVWRFAPVLAFEFRQHVAAAAAAADNKRAQAKGGAGHGRFGRGQVCRFHGDS